MCVSAWPASFSKTITGTWEVFIDGKINHVLWYQNRVGSAGASKTQADTLEWCINRAMQNPNWFAFAEKFMREFKISVQQVIGGVERRSGKPYEHQAPAEIFPAEGNCLIIPLMGHWNSIKLLNTAATPELLNDVAKALEPPPVPSDIQVRELCATFGDGIKILQFDIYDIVLAENAQSIPTVLDRVSENKRPKVNDAVFASFKDWYKCPVALCCFNSAEAGEAKPLAFAFEPLKPDELMVYTLDGHEGEAPNLKAHVRLDHKIFVGSYLMNGTQGQVGEVNYSDSIPAELNPYLLDKVMGVSIHNSMENGDITFKTDDVRSGKLKGARTLPPHAPEDFPRITQTISRVHSYATVEERSSAV